MAEPKIVLTMVARDEDDILETNLRYHRAMGVDEAIVIDHGSTDRTPEILEHLSAEGWVRQLRRETRDDGTQFPQAAWTTELSQIAFREHGAEWIVICDADEFWWPLRGDLKAMFAAVPKGMSVINTVATDFVARQGDGHFVDRMTVRETWPRNWIKNAHRGQDDVAISFGGHRVTGPGLRVAPWWPARMFHFPFRSPEQVMKRVQRRIGGGKKRIDNWIHRDGDRVLLPGEVELFYDDDAIDVGLEWGALAEDTRIRDFIRTGVRPATDFAAEATEVGEHVLLARLEQIATGTDRATRRLDRVYARIDKISAKIQTLERQSIRTRLAAQLRRT